MFLLLLFEFLLINILDLWQVPTEEWDESDEEGEESKHTQ